MTPPPGKTTFKKPSLIRVNFAIRSSWFIIYFYPLLFLNLNGWFGMLSNKFIIFDIPLSYYYINLKSSMIFFLSSVNIYLYLDISLSCSFIIVLELFCGELLETFVILLAILLLSLPKNFFVSNVKSSR